MIKDFVTLTKPAVTRMCLLTTLGGFLLAPVEVDVARLIAALVGTALAVGGANAFNMWWERDVDALMNRTRRRPLPAGRLRPDAAFYFALALSVASLVVLALGTNLLSAVIAAAAILSYVLVYTPLKRVSPAALVIGAIPGAAPPLLGWTAATGALEPPAFGLFAVLLIWQIPHFIAIALYRKDEYARAGIKVVPLVRGDGIAKIHAVGWTMILVPVSLLLGVMGMGGPLYFVTATLLGAFYFGWALTGLHHRAGQRWARGFFWSSLVYIPGLTLALIGEALF